MRRILLTSILFLFCVAPAEQRNTGVTLTLYALTGRIRPALPNIQF